MAIKKLSDDFKPWKGLLDEATKAGFCGTAVTIVQVPHPDNGHLAVVHVKTRFADGREFEDVGDADPQNCQYETAKALLRMACTRAKARCLRDALNVGEVADVELPTYGHQENYHAPQKNGTSYPVSDPHRAMVCSNPGCGNPLTKSQYEVSNRAYGAPLCPTCQKTRTRKG